MSSWDNSSLQAFNMICNALTEGTINKISSEYKNTLTQADEIAANTNGSNVVD